MPPVDSVKAHSLSAFFLHSLFFVKLINNRDALILYLIASVLTVLKKPQNNMKSNLNFVIILVHFSVFSSSSAEISFNPFSEKSFKDDDFNQKCDQEIRDLGSSSNNKKSTFSDRRISKRSIVDYHEDRHISKRSIVDHYEDSHCIDSFETSDKTIIRTIESKSNGAVFINNTEVETYERCLRFCCQTPMCTVAVWDQQVRVTSF